MAALTGHEVDILVVVLAWLAGFAPVFLRKEGWTWPRAVGLALLISPFIRMAIGVYLSVGALFTYEVLQPVPRVALWLSVQNRLIDHLVLPGIGLLLMHRAVPGFGRREAVPEALRAHGLAPRRSWRWDALRGLALFFAIAIAYLGALAVSKLIPSGAAGGDETQYWRNITILLILLLSAAAGLTEEFLFRGVLLRNLQRWMPWGVAAVAQALFFGLIHAGYGTWTHVLAPAVFGLAMAWVARVVGVLPAALLHAEVNVLFFTFDVAPAYIAANGMLGLAALAALVLTLAGASAYALWRTRADAVVLLWGSLMRGFRESPEAEAPVQSPPA